MKKKSSAAGNGSPGRPGALERLRRERDLARADAAAALERQQATDEILRVIASSPSDVQPVFKAIARSAVRLCRGKFSAVFRFDGELAHFVAHHGFSREGLAVMRSRYPGVPVGLLALAIRRRVAIHSADVFKDPRSKDRKLARAQGYRSFLAVPMLRDGKPIGAITVQRREAEAFSEHQIGVLKTFAAQAVIAVENARRFNDEKEALERQTATSDILRAISGSPTDTQPVFEVILDRATKLCDAETGILFRYADGAFYAQATRIPNAEFAAKFKEPRRPGPNSNTGLGRLMREKRTVHIHDLVKDAATAEGDPLRKDTLQGGVRTWLGVPLLKEGEMIGAILVYRTEMRPFSEQQISLLETFADQAVIAIENVRLFNETKEALERQTATAEILSAMSGSMTDAKPVFDAIVRSCSSLFKGSGVALRLLRDGILHVQANIGLDAGPLPVDRGSGVGACILDARTIHLPDIEAAAAEFPRVRQLGLKFGFRSGLYAPLLRDGNAIGTISVLRPAVGAFDDKDVALFNTFASQAVIAIENVRLFNETKESLERQTATAEILKVIASSPSDVQPVFEAIVQSALRLFPGWLAAVLVVDGDGIQLGAMAGADVTASEIEGMRALFPIPLDSQEAPSAVALRERRILEVLDTEHGHSFKAATRFARAGHWRAGVFVPMVREGRGIGTVVLTHREPGNRLSGTQLALVQTFADQAVIAIENVRLFNETRESLERQTATAEILKVIASSPSDVQPVFDAIASSAKRLLNAGAALVARRAGDMLHLAAFTSQGEAADAALQKLWPSKIVGQGHMGKAVLSGGPVLISDIEVEPGYSDNFKAMARTRGLRSIVSVPLMREGEAIGVISVNRPVAGKFSDHQTNLLRTFADQAVIAIENARLFNETKEALERQTATAEILKVIASSPSDVQPVFDAIAESSNRLLGGFSTAVIRVIDATMHLVAQTSTSKEGDTALQQSFPRPVADSSAVSQAIQECAPVIVVDTEVAGWATQTLRELARARGFRSVLFVPLIQNKIAIGTISVTRRAPGEFTKHEVELLTTFADQAVIAIENVRLFNETKEALERQIATAEILNVIAGSPANVQPVFDAIVQSAARLFDRKAALRLVEPDGLRRRAWSYAMGDEFHGAEVIPMERSSLVGSVALECKALQFADAQGPDSFPYSRSHAHQLSYRAAACAPLVRDGAAIGVITVTSPNPGLLSDKQLALLKTFADQAVIAIENVRLFNETKESLERQTATAEILKVIASSPSDVQPVFDAIAESAKRLFGGETAAVTRLAGDMLHLAAYTSTSEAGNEAVRSQFPRLISGPHLNSIVARTGAPVFRADMENDPEAPPEFRELARKRGYRSILGVPMLREGITVGTISVTRSEPGNFTDHQINLLKTFADQAVIAIENVRLFNETKEALERQTATSEVLRVISSSPTDVQPVFESIAESAATLCGAKIGFVAKFDGTLIHMMAFYGAEAGAIESVRAAYPMKPEGESTAARVVRSGVPVQIPDVLEDALYTHKEAAATAKFRSTLGVPLLRDNQIVGAIVVVREQAGIFQEKQIDLLKTFADQAVIAIENVRLFNETKESLERQTATAEILKVIASSPSDVQPVFDAILDNACKLCDSQLAAAYRFDGTLLHLVANKNWSAEALAKVATRYPAPPDPRSTVGRVALTGKVECQEDTLADPAYDQTTAHVGGWRRMLGVPLLREGITIGVIVVTWREPGPIAERLVFLLKTFADQAVIAIENVRLFNETKESLERQTATAEILQVISGSPTDVRPVFDAILDSATRLCDAHFALLGLYDGEQYKYVAHRGSNDEFGKWIIAKGQYKPQPGGGIARMTKDRRPIHIEDLKEAAAYRAGNPITVALADIGGVRTYLSVPMIKDGAVVGGITVYRPDVRPFTQKQVDLVSTFASQAVIAIQNVRLFNETKESLERQTATAEILQVIGSSPTDTQPVFDAIVNSGVRLFPGAMITVARPDGGIVRAAAIAHEDSTMVAGWKERFTTPLSRDRLHAAAILDAKLIDYPDAEAEKDGPLGPGVRNFLLSGNRAVTIMPMLRGEGAIGAISVTRAVPGPLSDKQIAILRTFADQAVIAIENVRLFNETKEALERQTATSEILGVISSSPTDLNPVFEAILENALRLCEARLGVLALYDGERFKNVAHLGGAAEYSDWSLQGSYVPDPKSTIGRAAAQRIPVHVDDLRQSDAYLAGIERTVKMADLGGARTVVAVPMLKEDQVAGVMVIYRTEVRPFSDKQVDLLRTFASQAVIAIENVRLFNETKEALDQQTATAEILQVISSSPTDTQPVFEAIVQSGLRLFPDAAVAVVLPEGNKARMAAVATRVPAQAAAWRARFPIPLAPNRLHAAAILECKLIDVPDAEAARHGPYAPGVENFLASGNKAITIAPMMCADAAIGAISVVREIAGALSEKQVALLRTFAAQAVIAIENVRVFKELEARTGALTRSVEQLTALGEVGQSISSTLDLDTVLKTIVQRAVQLTRMDGGSIYEYDERSEEFHLRAAENLSDEVVTLLRETPARKGEGVIGHAAETGEPTEIADMRDESYQSPRRDTLLRAGYRALLVVPLRREEHIIGALSVNRKEPGHFAHEVVELLKTFATQSAMAIQNARLFREIAEKGKQLEEASQHKSQFLASMSHELRTPLNAILGFNEMILGQVYGDVPADMQEPLKDIQTSGKHLLRLINNVLDLAKIEAGRMELSLQDYSVHDTVESVRATLRPLAAEKGLEFLTNVPNDLPLAYGDSGRITQCLMNLAGNSLKFTKAGRVEIAVAAKGELLVYKVSDTGIGIPPDKIASLFTEFRQTDATIASEYGGTGLGLSISRKFVEMHGGRIWVESEPGKGSAFIFEVPLRVKTP